MSQKREVMGRDYFDKPLYVGDHVRIVDRNGEPFNFKPYSRNEFIITGPGKTVDYDELGIWFFVKLRGPNGRETEKLDRWLEKLSGVDA